jgi:hypothetical protein
MPLVIKDAKLNIFPLMVECKFWYIEFWRPYIVGRNAFSLWTYS